MELLIKKTRKKVLISAWLIIHLRQFPPAILHLFCLFAYRHFFSCIILSAWHLSFWEWLLSTLRYVSPVCTILFWIMAQTAYRWYTPVFMGYRHGGQFHITFCILPCKSHKLAYSTAATEYMIEIMNMLIVMKLCASSVTFSYYISKHFHTKKCTIALFGMFYALSAYSAAYSWNIMWLDCIVLIPLIMLGLEKLVDENKCYLYCISLGLCIFTNYYISIMVCISVCLYFMCLWLHMTVTNHLEYILKRYYAGFFIHW